jgi:hypothetical protein
LDPDEAAAEVARLRQAAAEALVSAIIRSRVL